MNNSELQNQRFAVMLFSTVYPLYLNKVVRKGRTQDELNHEQSLLKVILNQLAK